jgi:hypothetical protein
LIKGEQKVSIRIFPDESSLAKFGIGATRVFGRIRLEEPEREFVRRKSCCMLPGFHCHIIEDS